MLDHLGLLTITRCNLRCGHCLRGYDHPAQDFPLALLPRLLGKWLDASAGGATKCGENQPAKEQHLIHEVSETKLFRVFMSGGYF